MRYFLQCWLLGLALCANAFAQAPGKPEHTLGAGDVIRVSVYQNPDLALETRVSEAGDISFPLVGTVKVGGLSVTASEQYIGKLLRDGGFVLKPQVNIVLLQIRSSQISILGQVGKPGRYPIEVVNSKVSEMIAAAGGVVPGASDIVTLVGTRDGKSVKFDIDLPLVMQAGKFQLDVEVANGDILYVDRAPIVYIYGEVQRPGSFRLERDMSVMQALVLGGGLTQRGTIRGLRIHRKDANGVVKIIEPKMNDIVERDDVIYIQESLF